MSPTPLQGIELLDCAQANAKLGLSTAAQQCGSGNNIRAFQNDTNKPNIARDRYDTIKSSRTRSIRIWFNYKVSLDLG